MLREQNQNPVPKPQEKGYYNNPNLICNCLPRSSSSGAPRLPLPTELLRPACCDWYLKVISFLCGKHGRLGAHSPIKQLPSKIIQKIVAMATPPMSALTGSSFDGDIRVWDLETGATLKTLRTSDFVIVAFAMQVISV